MLNLKKTAVAVLAFSSSAVFAGTMGPVCTPGNVTVPCEATAWNVGIQALYLQPTYNEEASYRGDRVAVVGNHESRTAIEHRPDWQWGFKLEGSYHFNTGNDVNLNWYHLGSKTTSKYYADADLFTTDGNDGSRSRVTIEPKWDAVNFEFGQHVDFGDFKNIRFHGGVQYARINTDRGVTSTFVTEQAAPIALVATARDTQKFNGFGPRIGADMSYDLGNGLGVYANSAASILSGTSKRTSSLVLADNAVVASDVVLSSFTTSAKHTQLVPEMEAKLGINYTYAMAQGDLSIDAGYMWVNYFNVQTVVESDFGVQGPFVGLKWVGTVV